MIANILLFLLKLFTITIIIFFIIFISNPSYVFGHPYDQCSSSPQPCGNVSNIGYPFWGNARPWYCGHPAFKLHCTDPNGYPILQINDSLPCDDQHLYFNVLHISNVHKNSSNTISKSFIAINLQQINHSAYSCPSDFTKNVAFDYFMNFNSNVSVIHLYYECHINKINASDFVTCFDDHYHKHRYTYSPNGQGFEGCKDIGFPVLKQELNKLQLRTEVLADVLEKGFVVDFDYSSCTKCEESGGICGSSKDQVFACYCKGNPQPQSKVCVKSENLKLKYALGVAGPLSGIVIILLALGCCYIRKRQTRQFAIFWKKKGAQHQNIEAFRKIYGSLALKRYTYANIRKWTNNFEDKLGEGGYGTVYKGKMPDGRLVAVKLLKEVKGNGEDFINEVASISRTNHVNIVALLGFCFEGSKRSLIYSFMSNGSLERFTYRGASYMSLSWETMFDIALGIAKGLDYLHRGWNARILHFDIKPHNILLDDELHPKISDFGLSKLCPPQESIVSMLEARGTIGYIAPEVFCRNFGGVSHKSDVCSYGMMVLDLVCGRTNTSVVQHSSEVYFPGWIYNQLEHGEDDIVLVVLTDQEKELQRKMILVSLWCIQAYPSNRPSMSNVIEMLHGCLESIQIPPKPYIASPPRLVAYTSETSTIV